MADNQEASVGWNGEVWMGTDDTVGTLAELVQVVSFGLPVDNQERVETTHLKSANRRREYTGGLIDGGEVDVVLNFRPGSDTDTKIETAFAAGTERSFRFNVPIAGTLTRSYTCVGIVTGYDRGNIESGSKMEATMTVALSGAVTAAAYTPPA